MKSMIDEEHITINFIHNAISSQLIKKNPLNYTFYKYFFIIPFFTQRNSTMAFPGQ